MPTSPLPTFLAWAATLALIPGAHANPVDSVDFLRDVRPILSSHCFKCHGPDEATRKGRLRLDQREDALRPARSGEPAIVPGHPDRSELLVRIFTENEDDLMPPSATKHPLSAAQKDTLKRWIEQGAEYRPHWAFVPPTQAPLPKGADARHFIDAWIQDRLAREGLTHSPEADRTTLIRRVSLDLIGLPPSPAEVENFLQETHPQAYERLVDRLLASEHYGERWARRWLDLARYSDTNGYEKDRPRSMWPWRDWVIQAFNQDLPFDQFTIQQIAGDLLPQPTLDQRIATGFHRNTMINEEGGIDPLEFRFLSMVDRVHTTATAWLGLTMACAQCHTHKYDPIQHREYFQFMAFLDNADEPVLDVPQPDLTTRRQEIEERIAQLQASLPNQFPPEDRSFLMTPAASRLITTTPAERLPDGSYRFGGPAPEREDLTFELVSHPSTPIHALVLEALADDALPKNGPGRSGSGNFVLSELEIAFRPADADPSTPWTPLPLASAQADFEQAGFPVSHAIDGQTDTGWAVAGEGAWNINRRAVFSFDSPVSHPSPTTFRIRLLQQFGSQHVLGRVRLSLASETPDPRPLAERRQDHLNQRFAEWTATEKQRARLWIPLTPLAATSNVPVLTIEDDHSIFVSSDQTKSDLYQLRFRNDVGGITALRLEALPDDRLPSGGPGRAYYEGPAGDFFLSTLTLRAGGQPVPLTRPSQSFANGGNDAAKAIDDDPQSGWSIQGGQGRRHVAVFHLKTPLQHPGELEIDLLFEKYYAAGLGRFRISVTTDSRDSQAIDLPDDLQIALLRDSIETSDTRKALLQRFLAVAPELASARAEIDQWRRKKPAYPTTLVLSERPASNPRTTLMRHRGEYLQPGEPVTAALPTVLTPQTSEPPHDRLSFARWLVSRDNPLTARVTVNRAWQAFFGQGLVRTMEDFGFQGELPSHPELLDTLAVDFMENGWSLKRLHRQIVLSATYRQSSHITPELLERDPENRLLARGPRFRVEAELIRDLALHAAGLLSPRIGGPSVFPPQLPSITLEGAYGPLEWKVSPGEDRYRRGLYTFAKRTAPYATFSLFDAPSGEACVAQRETSNTPLQSLALLNDQVFMEAAQAIGQWAAALDDPPSQRIHQLFLRTLARPPAPEETKRILAFYQAQHARLAAGELNANDIAGPGNGDPTERAAWTTVARALLNLDETITRG